MSGLGLPKDEVDAYKWFSLAADQGDGRQKQPHKTATIPDLRAAGFRPPDGNRLQAQKESPRPASSVTNNQQPTTNNQQPTTNNQQPTTKNKEPGTRN